VEERYKIAQEIFKIMIDEQFSIGTVGQSPATMGVRIVSRRMGNMASRQINAQHCRTPGTSHPATYFFKA
jgi:peptide/nickel transport system substrate-binding protein